MFWLFFFGLFTPQPIYSIRTSRPINNTVPIIRIAHFSLSPPQVASQFQLCCCCYPFWKTTVGSRSLWQPSLVLPRFLSPSPSPFFFFFFFFFATYILFVVGLSYMAKKHRLTQQAKGSPTLHHSRIPTTTTTTTPSSSSSSASASRNIMTKQHTWHFLILACLLSMTFFLKSVNRLLPAVTDNSAVLQTSSSSSSSSYTSSFSSAKDLPNQESFHDTISQKKEQEQTQGRQDNSQTHRTTSQLQPTSFPIPPPQHHEQKLQQNQYPQQPQERQQQAALHPTPPPISIIHDITFNSSSTRQFRQLSFLNPHVIKVYTRPSLTAAAPAIDLFIITIGLHLRKLSVSHCVVGDKLYPVESYQEEVSFCILPQKPSFSTVSSTIPSSLSLSSSSSSPQSSQTHFQNDLVTVVLNADAALHVALTQNISLVAGHVAKRLEIGRHLIPMQSDAKTMSLSPLLSNNYYDENNHNSGAKNTSQMLIIQSSSKYSQIIMDDFDPVNIAQQQRYAICMVTMTATAPHILSPWVDYHRTLGVDHVYILDNGMSTDISSLFSNRPDVEIVQWPFQKSQTQATLFVLLAARRRCHTLLKFDSDEYLLIGLNNPESLSSSSPSSSSLSPFANGRRPLQHFLNAKRASSRKSNVLVLSLVMCNSGYLDTPTGPLPQLYTHMRKQQDLHSGKSFCDTLIDWRAARVHPCGISVNGIEKQALTTPKLIYLRNNNYTHLLQPHFINDTAWLIHFYARSWEEWVEKWTIGTAGIASGIGKDSKIGMYDRLNPDPDYIDENNEQCRPFPILKDRYNHIIVHRDQRIKESVLTWQVNGSSSTMIVQLWWMYGNKIQNALNPYFIPWNFVGTVTKRK